MERAEAVAVVHRRPGRLCALVVAEAEAEREPKESTERVILVRLRGLLLGQVGQPERRVHRARMVARAVPEDFRHSQPGSPNSKHGAEAVGRLATMRRLLVQVEQAEV
ncbi:hypothetical protein CCB80_03310 [Armatimonadetes bacterium Uphvl-Ar1]|nr:hypothetical protein CCB80_03310 [Armatimonadetes bacterium Uphvl-Ar1]